MKNLARSQPTPNHSLNKFLLSCCLAGFGASAPVVAWADHSCGHLSDPYRNACENRIFNAELGEKIDENEKARQADDAAQNERIDANETDIEQGLEALRNAATAIEKNEMARQADDAAQNERIDGNMMAIEKNEMARQADDAAQNEYIHGNVMAIERNEMARMTADSVQNQNIAANASNIASNTSSIMNLDRRLVAVDERVSQVAAMAAALSAVPTAPPGGERDFFVGVGVGNSDGEQGVAVGISGRFGEEKNIFVNAGFATSGDDSSVRAGVGWAF